MTDLPESTPESSDDFNLSAEQEMKQRIIEQLELVIDPELGIDIVNLGLVYDVEYRENNVAYVLMTLTTPACPLADVIFDEVDRTVKALAEVDEVKLELSFYPPWQPDRMSRYARIALGFSG
ncbi:metal-sulfur cluster assembly factor [Fundicoccus sp. Sow4_F4]|uniref:metal-sulfur cluster assembly factor n=1 Tax=Fundicoccus sp. Sow4_F4 TaxID=3438783 RepID=UPI003F93142F